MIEALKRIHTALAGRYTVERELGRGAMAIVYLAEDIKHGRKVAVKVLGHDVAAAIGRDRFLREIRITAQLNHPHILPLIDSGEAGEFLYYVIPVVEGESLRDRLARERQLSIGEALRITRQTASALAYAHSQAIVHRDIKPGNILFHHGETLLADFGIAVSAPGRGHDQLTVTGVSLGTPMYMSPEQITGDRIADARSDIYSLGCVLYEMLAGEPPHYAATMATLLAKRLREPVPSIKRLREDVPDSVDAALQRALAPVPADRFATVTEFAESLTAPVHTGRHTGSKSIAVLPFVNLSSDPDNEYFSDGVTEDVLTRVSKIETLHVISRTSAMRYKRSTKSVGEIAGELGVSTVLEGSVRRVGDRVRVTAQLIDAASDRHLWANSFDRVLTDVFAIQSEIAERIAEALGATLTPAERLRIARRPTDDIEAYNLYLLGRHVWDRLTEDDVEKSISFFERAIQRDPKYALAHYGLGIAWMMLALGYWSRRPRETYPIARRALIRALELDPEMAEAHTSLALITSWFDFDWSGAGRMLQRALDLDPNSSQVHDGYGVWLTAHGRHQEAAAHYEQACRLDPLSGLFLSNAALGAYRAREYDRAIAWFDREIALDPHLPVGRALSALVHVQRGDTAKARAESMRAREFIGTHYPATNALYAYVCAACGDSAEALELLGELDARRATENIWLFVVAMAYARLGDVDTAFARLEEAVDQRGGWIAWVAVEPALDPLRADPRFAPLVRSVGLEPGP